MKNGFLAFPTGSAGLGLLALRFSVAISLMLPPYGSIAPHSAAAVGWDLLAIAVAFGLWARAAASLAVTIAIGILVVNADRPGALFISFALSTVALALIGPGAASIDARLFGRRTISLTR